MKLSRRVRSLLAAGACVGLVTASGCSRPSDSPAGAYDQVVIAVPDWPGGQANAAVAGYVLENELGTPIGLRPVDQAAAWDALDDGSIHALLEDWGALPEKTELYRDKKQSVVDGGMLGITGHVGWFVPQAYADEHPEVLDWRNLNDFAAAFRTPASGREGQLLHGDPEYATWDDTLIEELGLDFETVAAGSEGALIDAVNGAGRRGAPLLAYWWEPHWLNAKVDMAEVKLPPHSQVCQDGADGAGSSGEAASVACGYPDIPLRKYLSADFAARGGAAADFLRAFSWSAGEQNEVAALIADEGMSPWAAAEQWVTEHPAAVAGWLPDEDSSAD